MSGFATTRPLGQRSSRSCHELSAFQAKLEIMPDCKFHVGRKDLFQGDSPSGRFSAFFEDDGDTGYFYALDLERADADQILDAVQVYNVANVVDADRPSELSIIWSADGLKCALLINDYPHASFDFAARRGYCRTNFPNFPDSDVWFKSSHEWSDVAIAWLRGNDPD
jgi:hypothetical protein